MPQEEHDRKRVERARGCTTAVHLLSAEEAKSLFEDVVNGLAFLVRYCRSLRLERSHLMWQLESMIDRFCILTSSLAMCC